MVTDNSKDKNLRSRIKLLILPQPWTRQGGIVEFDSGSLRAFRGVEASGLWFGVLKP